MWRRDPGRIADFCEDPYWTGTFEFPNEQGEAVCFDASTHDVDILGALFGGNRSLPELESRPGFDGTADALPCAD